MIIKNGKVFNLTHVAIARVCESFSICDSDSWFFSSNPDFNMSCFSGFIIPSSLKIPNGCGKPILQIDFSEDSNPKHNDIIIIYPNGTYSTLFDSRYDSNSIVLSNACDCKCIMCPQVQKGNSDDLSLCYRLIELLPTDINWLGITGGEPTLIWDGLLEIITRCISKYSKIRLQLLTNAHVFSDSGRAKELASISAKRLFVSVPIYSDNPIDHDNIVMQEGAFFKTILGIQNLESVGIPIELRNVLMAKNYSRLAQLARFILNNLPFVDTVALMSLEMEGQAIIANSPVWIPIKETWKNLIELKLIFDRANIQFRLFNFPLCVLPKVLRSHSVKSISEWKREYCKKCDSCTIRDSCGGFFNSSLNYLLPEIEPIIEEGG